MEKKILGILLLIAIGISAYYFFTKPLWMEPDSTAFYNRTCLNGKDFETPIISRTIFSILPCNETIWKIFHFLIILSSISALYYFNKKVLKNDYWFLFSFLSYFLLIFLLNIEDDQIAFPIITVLSARLLIEQTQSKKIGYAIATIFLTKTVWAGSFIPMTLFLSYTINPVLPIIIPIIYIIYDFIISGTLFFSDPGGTIELIAGYGFLTNDIPLLLLFFVKDKKKKILENKNLFFLLTGFNIVAFAYPKFAYYVTLPLLIISFKFFEDKQKQLLMIAGIVALVIAPAIILFNSAPNQKTWSVIDLAVQKQSMGFPVYNEWFVGRWFHYKGGKASSEGGSSGEQTIIEKEYYWLGTPRMGCETIDKAGNVFFQHCLNPT